MTASPQDPSGGLKGIRWFLLEDRDAVARRAAETLVRIAREAMDQGRNATVALSGGSTPKVLFRLLAAEYRERIDWQRIEIFFGDERCVPPEHADSNFRTARELLLDHVPVPREQIHRMEAEDADLEEAARRYEARLAARVVADASGWPVLDLIWLGLGDDGHTASLFPGTAALEETHHAVVANEVPQLDTRRVTLTFPVLNHAARVQFLVTGEAKTPVIAAIHAGSTEFPAARVRSIHGRVEWLLDRAAASAIDG